MKTAKIICLAFYLIAQSSYGQEVIRLYESKAPGSENWDWSEQISTQNMFNTEIVYNVADPTITAYLPDPSIATGTAVVIAPGGAFHTLSINSEGIDVAKWLQSKGVAGFVLKYRVVKSETADPLKETMDKMQDPVSLDKENAPVVKMAINDGKKAIEHIRNNAEKYNLKKNKIGLMGFSAGGTLTMGVGFSYDAQSRPDFLAPIYPYMNAIEDQTVPADAPPLFIAVASDDQLKLAPHSTKLYDDWLKAGKTAELHAYQKGGHGFGMRKLNLPTDTWYERFGEWLKLNDLMTMPPIEVSLNPRFKSNTPNDTLQYFRILPDNRVKFSIYAPRATNVEIMGDIENNKVFHSLPLKKEGAGVWSYTTEHPLTPDIYTYIYHVDGVKTFDPKNTDLFSEGKSGVMNLVEIPGKENDFQSVKNVPHGKLETVHYVSNVLDGAVRRMQVYSPPDYDGKSKLPVFYLLHGGGGNDVTWTSIGRANIILDNLYAEGKIEPMLVVIPSGHTPKADLAMGAGPSQDPFCQELVADIIPFVEKNYNVSSQTKDRAIAGLSMGGIQTLNIALWNPKKFAYVYPMSTGYFPPVINELKEKYSDVLKNPAINKFKVFKIGMGKDDALAYKNNIAMMGLFDKFNIKYKYEETEGGHTFMVWRKNLASFAPTLFK